MEGGGEAREGEAIQVSNLFDSLLKTYHFVCLFNPTCRVAHGGGFPGIKKAIDNQVRPRRPRPHTKHELPGDNPARSGGASLEGWEEHEPCEVVRYSYRHSVDDATAHDATRS